MRYPPLPLFSYLHARLAVPVEDEEDEEDDEEYNEEDEEDEEDDEDASPVSVPILALVRKLVLTRLSLPLLRRLPIARSPHTTMGMIHQKRETVPTIPTSTTRKMTKKTRRMTSHLSRAPSPTRRS